MNSAGRVAAEFRYFFTGVATKRQPTFAKKRNAVGKIVNENFDVNGCRHSISGPGRVAGSGQRVGEFHKARGAESKLSTARSQVGNEN